MPSCDTDFLLVGGAGCDKNVSGLRCPGQSDVEYATEMSLWCMAAAPLIVATDIRNWTPTMKSILLNYELVLGVWLG
jgi:alpha-galactosidase